MHLAKAIKSPVSLLLSQPAGKQSLPDDKSVGKSGKKRISVARWRLLLLALTLASAVLSNAAAQSPRWQDSYAAALNDALVAVRQGQAARAADSLARVTQASVAEGYTLPVNNGDLLAALRDPAPDLPLVDARLNALLAEVRAAPDGRPPDPAVFAALDGVLARPEFQPAQPDAVDSFIGDLLRRLLNLPVGGGQIGVNVVAVAGTLLVLAVLGALIYNLWRTVVPSTALPVASDLAGERLSAREALAQAGTLAAGGDYRAAVRYLYLSTLLLLDERRALRYDRSLTNREVLAQVADNAALVERLRPVVDEFDRVWYGFAPLDEAEYETYRRQIERVRELRETSSVKRET